MAFNITSWGKKGRNYGRGAPPPRGSIEYIAVGDMWQAEPPRPVKSSSGFSVYEISFTELDAAERWVNGIDRNVDYSRKIHGEKILSKEDYAAWADFMKRWLPFKGDMQLPGHFNTMLKSNKKLFDDFMNESKKLHDRFVAKGIPMIPVPYMGELVALLRGMPKQLTAGQMAGKLAAGIKCGEKMLDENFAWFYWMLTPDARGLKSAIREAKTLADAYSPSRNSPVVYSAGDPAHDEFMRRLTRIWIEAAGLYGMKETRASAAAEAVDKAREKAGDAPKSALWLLITAGVAYLGMFWLAGRNSKKITVAVPDAIPYDPL